MDKAFRAWYADDTMKLALLPVLFSASLSLPAQQYDCSVLGVASVVDINGPCLVACSWNAAPKASWNLLRFADPSTPGLARVGLTAVAAAVLPANGYPGACPYATGLWGSLSAAYTALLDNLTAGALRWELWPNGYVKAPQTDPRLYEVRGPLPGRGPELWSFGGGCGDLTLCAVAFRVRLL